VARWHRRDRFYQPSVTLTVPHRDRLVADLNLS